MTELQLLMAEVITNPEDDTVRLAAADWYEENGQPERAEYIRCEVELYRLRNITISYKDWGRLLTDRGYRDYLMMSPWALRAMIDGNSIVRGPVDIYGTSVTVAKRDDTGLDTLDKIKNRPDQTRIMELLRRSREASGRYLLENEYGEREWSWFGPSARVAHTTTRGWISSVTCAAAQWVKAAETLYWTKDEEAVKLGVCGRECPVTAQPVTKVFLTDDDLNPTIHVINLDRLNQVVLRGVVSVGKIRFSDQVEIDRMGISNRQDAATAVEHARDVVRSRLAAHRLLPRMYPGVRFTTGYNPETFRPAGYYSRELQELVDQVPLTQPHD